jgi:hypothetical protein
MLQTIRFIFIFLLFSNLQANEETSFSDIYEKAIQHDREQDITEMEITLSSEFEPLSHVEGCVNVATGDFFQAEEDFIGDTIDPIHLMRFYDVHSYYETFLGYRFGCQFPLLATPTQESARHTHALIEERNGCFLPYQGKSDKHVVDPRIFKKGYTNVNGERISAQSNHSNWSAKYKKGWIVQEGDGTKRFYNRYFKLIEDRRRQLGVPTRELYLLTEEIKPNGNRLKFDYQMSCDKPFLSKVWTVNRKGETINSIDIHYSDLGCTLESSCGKRVEYLQEQNAKNLQFVYKIILNQVNSSQKGTTTYNHVYHNFPNVHRVNKPDGRFEEVFFHQGKVVKLLKNNGAYFFAYDKQETLVQDPLKQKTLYKFDSHNRLKSISYLENGSPVRQEVFKWNIALGQEGRLKSKAIKLGKRFYQLTEYLYDDKGNVIEKRFFGNLTGKRSSSFLDKAETDHYSKTYSYSQDHRNLLMSQSTPFGWSVSYDYLAETNLRTSAMQSYDGKIQERIFYTYDDNGEIKSKIEDDGSSINTEDNEDVTYQRVTTILPVANPKTASYGKPREIIEGYRCNGVTKLLTKKVFLRCSRQGNFSFCL